MSEVYRNSLVGDSFDRIEIEAFSKGSVLVDYYVYFKDFEEQVSTSDLKIVLNQQLEDRPGMLKLGRFRVDPDYTDFIGKSIQVVCLHFHDFTSFLIVLFSVGKSILRAFD